MLAFNLDCFTLVQQGKFELMQKTLSSEQNGAVIPERNEIDYYGVAEDWLDNFLAWREVHGPNEHLAVARELRPSRLQLPHPNSAIDNLMVRSTNSIDEGQVQRIAAKRGMAKSAIKAGRAFYRNGNYHANRHEFLAQFSDNEFGAYLPELYDRLSHAIKVIPERSLQQHGFSKLCRTIGGFAFLALLEQGNDSERDMSIAMRAGYDFAITYPLVDDLLHDSDYLKNRLTTADNRPFDLNQAISTMLTTGSLEGIEMPKSSITQELVDSFNDALAVFPFEQHRDLYDAARVLHDAQLADAQHRREGRVAAYEREDYVPYIVKAAMTRIIPVMALGRHKGAPQIQRIARIMGLGMRAQLHDDLVDIHEDYATDNSTPYSPYITGESPRPDINPAEMFIDTLFYSVATDYTDTYRRRAAKVLLGTAAHAFSGMNEEAVECLEMDPKYHDLIRQLTARYPSSKIEGVLQNKLDAVALSRSRIYKELDVYLFDVQQRTDEQLENFIEDTEPTFQDAYRYALLGGAKRLRPAFAYITGDTFGMSREYLDSFGLAAELLHAASLIFDDLPGQDNAELRRGRPTLHTAFNESTAQMTALALIFDAQKILAEIEAKNNLEGRLSNYVNEILGQRGLCRGQLQDLRSFGTFSSTTESLDEMAHLKTGLAIEMSIVGPAIMAGLPSETIDRLRGYAYHAGIAFQVKDDLLDAASENITGKTKGIDKKNGKPTFVSVLGINGATEKLAHHLEEAKKALTLIVGVDTLKYQEILSYIQKRHK